MGWKREQAAKPEDHRPEVRHRVFLSLVCGSLTLMYAFLLVRLVDIQLLHRDAHLGRAIQYHRFKRDQQGARGWILDRRGEVLADSVPVKCLWARPAKIGDRAEAARVLAGILPSDEEWILERISSKGGAVCLAETIDSNDAIRELERAILELNRKEIKGLDLHNAFRRDYVNGRELSHVLGCIGSEGYGLTGIENRFDASLQGGRGFENWERDGKRRPFYSAGLDAKPPTRGTEIRLTIDSVIQHFLEREVEWAHETWQATSVMGVVVSPPDGRILALANRPTFDPNRLGESQTDDLTNRAIHHAFAPGSSFKPFIIAAALEEGRLGARERIDCGEGRHSFQGRVVKDVHPRGILEVPDVLVHSSNIGTAKIGLRLGGEKLREYLDRFGFGRRTGICLPGEAAGKITRPKDWTEKYTTVSVSFGQEIAVTAIQMAMGFSALINGGRWNPPRLIENVVDPEGNVDTLPLPVPRRVLSPDVSATIREMLVGVVEEGSGVAARVEGYRVGGKTGTAEKFVGKLKKGYVSTFVGFAPAEYPRLCVVIMVNEPQGQHFARAVAVPAAGRVLADALAYLEIVPNEAPSRSAGADLAWQVEN